MNTMSPFRRRSLFIIALLTYMALVLYAARADVPFYTSFFILQILGFITFVAAMGALLRP